MLRYDPTERLTAHQALGHPFFATPCVSLQGGLQQPVPLPLLLPIHQGSYLAGFPASGAVLVTAVVSNRVASTAVVAAGLGAGAIGSAGGTASSGPLPPALAQAAV